MWWIRGGRDEIRFVMFRNQTSTACSSFQSSPLLSHPAKNTGSQGYHWYQMDNPTDWECLSRVRKDVIVNIFARNEYVMSKLGAPFSSTTEEHINRSNSSAVCCAPVLYCAALCCALCTLCCSLLCSSLLQFYALHTQHHTTQHHTARQDIAQHNTAQQHSRKEHAAWSGGFPRFDFFWRVQRSRFGCCYN